jgi:hypothetical protein
MMMMLSAGIEERTGRASSSSHDVAHVGGLSIERVQRRECESAYQQDEAMLLAPGKIFFGLVGRWSWIVGGPALSQTHMTQRR